MATITKRLTKGTPLTNAEVDDNFQNLNNALGANNTSTIPTPTGTGGPVLNNSPSISGTLTAVNLAYTGTLTGGTSAIAIGTNQIYKDVSGNVGIGNIPSGVYKLEVSGSFSATTLTSTIATGTAPFVVSSSTNVINLNASSLNGATFAAPGAIGSGTASTGAFTTLYASGTVSGAGFSTYLSNSLASPPAIGGTAAAAGKFTNLEYTGTLTGGTGVIAIGTNQIYKDASGNVGIGTSSPGAILHTSKTSVAAATVGAFIQNSDNTVGTEVRLGFAANTNLLSQDRYGWIGYVNTEGTNSGALTFATTIGGIPATERMRIDSSGNVGIGVSTAISAILHLKAGTNVAGTAPLKLNSIGTKLTTAEAGAIEYDGVAPYFTSNTTSGRGFIPTTQMFRLISSGTGITATATGTNYFGANSNIALASNSVYEIEIVAFFLKTTATTVLWNLVFSAAPNYTVHYEMSPVTGIVAPPGSATMFVGQAVGQTLTTYVVTTASLTTGVNHYARFKLFVQTSATSTSMKINAYNGAAGTITPLAGSYWKAIQIPANTGNFVA